MSIIKRKLIILSVLLLTSCSIIAEKPAVLDQRTTPISKPTPKQNNILQNAPQATPPLSNNNPKIINKKVKVAVLVPLSGKSKELGAAIVNSITLSLFENDQNNDVELVLFDSKDDPSDALTAIKEIAAQNIKVVIGPIFSTSTQSIAKIAKDNNITLLSFSNNQDLMNKPSVFLMGFLPEQQVERIVSYSISRGKNNFAILAPNNQYGITFSSLIKTMVKKKDGNFITSGLYLNNSDLDKTVKKTLDAYIISSRAASKGKAAANDGDKIYADVILVPESGSALFKAASSISKNNNNEREIQIIGSSSWDDASTLNDSNLIGAWFPAPAPEKYREFEKKYYQIYGKYPPRISSIAYDAIIAVIKTIPQSRNRDLKASDFVNYRSNKNAFEGIDGTFRFLPNGLVQRNFAVLQVGSGKFDTIDSPSTMFFKY